MKRFWFNILKIWGYIFFFFSGIIASVMLIGIVFGNMVKSLTNEEHLAQEANSPHYDYVYGEEKSKKMLLSIPIEGIILGSRTSNEDAPWGMLSMGMVYGYEVKKQLMDAATDADIKGILLEINTPGGTIFGSQEIYEGIKFYREKSGKPVIAYIQGMSASGGVWSMVGANAIYADYGSVVGSIGILGPALQNYNSPVAINGGLFAGGVTTTGGIETHVIHSGKGKDLGNPFRKPTEEELAELQKICDAEYEKFVKHVSETRGIEPALIKNTLGAMIMDNDQAKNYKLIDGTKTFDESVAELAKASGVEADYKLVRITPPRVTFKDLLGVSSSLAKLNTGAYALAAKNAKCGVARNVAIAYYGNVAELCQ